MISFSEDSLNQWFSNYFVRLSVTQATKDIYVMILEMLWEVSRFFVYLCFFPFCIFFNFHFHLSFLKFQKASLFMDIVLSKPKYFCIDAISSRFIFWFHFHYITITEHGKMFQIDKWHPWESRLGVVIMCSEFEY